MANLQPTALALAGFTLAHAVWDVSVAEQRERLTPLAFVERAGRRRLVRFEGDTHDEAVEQGRQTLRAAVADAWAFARQGTWSPEGVLEPVVVVEFWGPGMERPATVMQPFERAGPEQRVQLRGAPTLVVGDQPITPDDARAALDALRDGIRSHDVAGKYWSGWQDEEGP